MSEQPIIPNNSEIEQALKEFEVKAGQEQNVPNQEHPVQAVITPQSSQAPNHEVEGVKFETENYGAIKFYRETVAPKMVKAVIKYSGGTVKNQRQAEWILLAFVILAMGISVFLIFIGNKRAQPNKSVAIPPGIQSFIKQ